MYYDVKYKGPSGSIGTHYAVEEESVEKVSERSKIMLCFGTPFKPEDFTVLSVVTSTNIPIIK